MKSVCVIINKVEATELNAGSTSGNSRICEVEAGESESQGLFQLSKGFDANLGHIRSHINNTIKKYELWNILKCDFIVLIQIPSCVCWGLKPGTDIY